MANSKLPSLAEPSETVGGLGTWAVGEGVTLLAPNKGLKQFWGWLYLQQAASIQQNP